jgi:hypothetical protein
MISGGDSVVTDLSFADDTTPSASDEVHASKSRNDPQLLRAHLVRQLER